MRQDRESHSPDRSGSIDPAPRVLVVGFGNDDRGDDAIGLVTARRVRDLCLDGVDVEELGGDALTLLESWNCTDTVILIDAMSSGVPVGTVMRFDALADDLSTAFGSQVSSHGIGVAEVVALAKALDRSPAGIIIYGIEGTSFHVGAPLNPRVADSIDITIRRIAQETNRKG